MAGYLFQHSYYGKLLIFPGYLSWDRQFFWSSASYHPLIEWLAKFLAWVRMNQDLSRTIHLMLSQYFAQAGGMCDPFQFALLLGHGN